MELTKEEIQAVAQAPEELKDSWTETQQFIAKTVRKIQKELQSEGFGGDKNHGTN